MFLEQSEKQVALRKEIRAYFSKTNATLLNNNRNDNFYLSGYGLHTVLGLNINLFKNFFIQTELKGGYTSLPTIRTTANKSDTASQDFFYIQYNLVFCFFF